MNTESIATRKVESGQMEQPGDFCFNDDRSWIYVWLPGQKASDSIRIRREDNGSLRVWKWDGNEDAPTLEPSIDLPGEWHGFLRAGRLQSC